MRISRLYRGIAIVLLLAVVVGCGKKGALYRPGEKAPAEQSGTESGKTPTGDLPPATPSTQP